MKKENTFNLIDIDDASKMLGVSMDTMRRWDKKGKLRAIRLTTGGKRKYKREDIYKFIDGGLK